MILNDNPIINAEITEEYVFILRERNILYVITVDKVLKKTWVIRTELKISPDEIIINGKI